MADLCLRFTLGVEVGDNEIQTCIRPVVTSKPDKSKV